MSLLAAAASTWAFCSVIAYGMAFAHTQQEWPTIAQSHCVEQRVFCAIYSAVFGPFALVCVFIDTRARHGFKWW